MVIKAQRYFFDFMHQNFEGFPESLEKVVVISYFGKSFYDVENVKASGFKPFKQKMNDKDLTGIDPHVEGYYDSIQKTVHLHVQGVFDVYSLVHTLNKVTVYLEEKGYLTTWADLKHSYAKVLMFLFSVSHIIILCHPVPVFDMSYIHLFKALDAVRLKALEKLSSEIKQIDGLSKDWQEFGRPCSPRMLFRFDSCPRLVKDIKKFEHNLEDQIFHILKKCKVISNISSNSLFSIPANQEFVFVNNKSNRPGNRINGMVNSLIRTCLNQKNDLGQSFTQFNALTVEYNLKREQEVHTFDKFLAAHVQVALTKGFDDNLNRHAPPAPFTLPTPKQFIEVSKKSYFHMVNNIPLLEVNGDSSVIDEDNYVELLRDYLDIDSKFSEARCIKVLPLALAAYQESSPFHYTREYHERRLAQAMAVLSMHGRGTMIDKYATQLEKECIKHWKNGRQMCQVLSLTGHPCTNVIHKGGGEGAGGGEVLSDDESARSKLEIKEHANGVRYVSACNCGRRQAPRPDPYTLRAANYDFYVMLSEECGCDEFDLVRFPVFQPSTKDYKAAQLFGRRESNIQSKSDIGTATPQEGFSLAYVSGQSGAGSDLLADARLSCNQSGGRTNDQEIVIQVADHEIDANKDKNLVRQPSTTEYLPGMLHTESPSGLLPQFSSWSIVCLGPSSLYSHNLGLQDQPGLLPGSSYLLPWDVTVRLEHQRKSPWASGGDFRKHNMQMRLRKNKGDQSEFVVKIFVGVEYECPRGHRFMAAAPDKVLKTSNSGQVKDTGHKVTSADMPLYFQCPCRPNKPLIAQLMRIHVVTPKAPVRVTLNPKVQPVPGGPTFIASTEQPVPLSQSAYWVLRLPYVYMSERVPFLPPQEITPQTQGRFLSGCYGIAEISPEKN